MNRKKLIFRSFATLLLSTVLAIGAPALMMPGLKSLPIISDTSITAEAASKCYTIENGTMTLMNNVNEKEIKNLQEKEGITKIVAMKGTILPENCESLFSGFKNVVSIDLSKANTGRVKNMKKMFFDLQKVKTLDITGFDTSQVTDMSYMFWGCLSLKEIDVRSFNTGNVRNMANMFGICKKVTKLDVSGFDTSNVTSMQGMFDCCNEIKELDLGGFDTSNVTDMSMMFRDTKSLYELDLSGFNTAKLTNVESMFSGSFVKKLNIKSFSSYTLTNTKEMFKNCEVCVLNLGHKFVDITEDMALSNDTNGWARGSADSQNVAGNGEYAFFSNSGFNTYYKINVLFGLVEMEGDPVIQGKLYVKVLDCNCPIDSLTFKWYRDGVLVHSDMEGTYELLSAFDVGKNITCRVMDVYKKYSGYLVCGTDRRVEKMEGPAAPTGVLGQAPGIKGASDGKITGVNTTMEYETKTDFSHAIRCTSTVIAGLEAGTYYVRVAKTDIAKTGEFVKVIVPEGKEALSGKVSITGTLKYGQTLTAKVSDSNASKFTYQWERGGNTINGAISSTYKLVKEDIGQVISCEVKDADGTRVRSISGKTSAKIDKADGPTAPSGLKGIAPSKKGGSDGKINGVKTTMEYSNKSDFSAKVAVCTSTTIKNLKAGTYYVRIKETETTYGSKATKVVVPEGADPIDNKNDVTKIFKDVKAGEWYVSAIQFVYDRKYMSGVSSNLFGTNTAITREQFVTVLYNMEGRPSAKYRKVFDDVNAKQFYSEAVIWAYDNKITEGVSKTVFGTGNIITREQLATMLYKYSQYKKLKGVSKNKDLTTFPDYKKISSWAKEGMTWAVSNSVVSGKASNGKNYLDPAGKATRAECAQMIKNLFDNVIKK